MRLQWIYGLVLVLPLGCSSMTTVLLDRNEDGSLSRNCPNPIHGIPVMLKVPSHLDINVREVTYWSASDNELTPINSPYSHREVDSNLQYTEKMFVVDPMKPGAGTENYGFTFKSGVANPKSDSAGHGYLDSVTYRVEDKTITQSATLLANVLPLLKKPPTLATKTSAEAFGLITTSRVIAFRRFNINAPDFEQQVASFLDMYLNDCNRCNETLAPHAPLAAPPEHSIEYLPVQ